MRLAPRRHIEGFVGRHGAPSTATRRISDLTVHISGRLGSKIEARNLSTFVFVLKNLKWFNHVDFMALLRYKNLLACPGGCIVTIDISTLFTTFTTDA